MEDLVFIGNPLEEELTAAGKYTNEIIRRLLYLKKLDGNPVIREVEDDEEDACSMTLDLGQLDMDAGGSNAESPRGSDGEGNEDDNEDEENEDEDEEEDEEERGYFGEE